MIAVKEAMRKGTMSRPEATALSPIGQGVRSSLRVRPPLVPPVLGEARRE